MIGCDIRDMDEETKNILFNKDILAINQDSELNRPFLINSCDDMSDPEDTYTYVKILEDGSLAVGFFNFTDTKAYRFVTEELLGLSADIPLEYTVKDLWSGEEIKPVNTTINAEIPPHGCRLYKITPKI